MKPIQSLYSVPESNQRKRWHVTPDRRTIVVLTTLLSAMTLVSATLLMIEPGPIDPVQGISLQVVDPPLKIVDPLQAEVAYEPWLGIVIHDSGSLGGSAQSLDHAHRQAGLESLGYHFVIHNGQGGPDGELFASPRWIGQQAGAYCGGPGAEKFNRHAVGVCMIGDFDSQKPTDAQMDALVKLVRGIQSRFQISADQVWVQTGRHTDAASGRMFPLATLRRQLRNF